MTTYNNSFMIIHQGAVGDLILTFPAILMLKQGDCPFNKIDLFCQSKIGKLALCLRIADTTFAVESAYFSSLFSDAAATEIKDLLNSYNNIILFSYSEQLEQRINQITGNKVFRIPPRPDVNEKIHISEYIFNSLVKYQLLKKSDYSDILPAVYPKTDSSYDPEKILIHPGSGSRRKNWRLSYFAEVYEHLRFDGMNPEWILGPAEDFLLKELQNNYNEKIHIFSELTEIALLLGRSGGFIGNDSGITHLAAFMGIPTIAIFGPSDPKRWRPIGRSVSVIRPDELDCSPCFESEKRNCDNPECLNKTSPEMVVKAFYEIMSDATFLNH